MGALEKIMSMMMLLNIRIIKGMMILRMIMRCSGRVAKMRACEKIMSLMMLFGDDFENEMLVYGESC